MSTAFHPEATTKGLTSARLVFPSGAFRLNVRAGEVKDALYQAHFEGLMPEVKTTEGVVMIRYPQWMSIPGKEKTAAEVTLSRAMVWQIVIDGGASEVTARLAGCTLAGLELRGGLSKIDLDLPTPTNRVPIYISGGASQVIIRRPVGVAARVHLAGWTTALVFDEQHFGTMGDDVRLQSSNFDATRSYYAIEIANSASQLTIISG